MSFLHDLPIRRKLTVVAMLPSALAVLLVGATFVEYERRESRQSLLKEMGSAAVIVGDNSAAALSFADPSSASETLRSLDAHRAIVMGALYDAEGNLFASHRREGLPADAVAPPARPSGHRFGADVLEVFHTIELAGERAGTVYLLASLASIRTELQRTSLVVVLTSAVASLAAFLLASRLQFAISGPVSHLAAVAERVARERDYSLRAVKSGRDEMGDLVDAFNEMLREIQTRNAALSDARDHLEQRVSDRTWELREEVVERRRAEAELERAHRELVVASRQAGMAEVAGNVLHNVGNVLNSVNVSADVVADTLRGSRVSGLSQAVALLAEHRSDLPAFLTSDPRGSRLPSYLSALAGRLTAERETVLDEIGSLRRNIEHIKEVVAMQQSYARVAGVVELVEVADLVEDSLRLNAGALSRHGIEAIREFDPVPRLNVDRHKVLQILINLLRNAKYACDESNRADKRVTLRVNNGGDRVRISIIDNGVGIPHENLTRIFRSGFTTRATGHGFGLHGSALAAGEMGGTLVAHSGGVGHGATFTLELPLPTERSAR